MFDEIKHFFMVGIILVIIDFFYLKIMSNHFSQVVSTIQGGKEMRFRNLPAFVCYLFLVFGLYYFIIRKNGSVLDAAILGWVIYGVFDNTSAAIFEDWDLKSIIIDTTWGGILFALTTFIYNKINNII